MNMPRQDEPRLGAHSAKMIGEVFVAAVHGWRTQLRRRGTGGRQVRDYDVILAAVQRHLAEGDRFESPITEPRDLAIGGELLAAPPREPVAVRWLVEIVITRADDKRRRGAAQPASDPFDLLFGRLRMQVT